MPTLHAVSQNEVPQTRILSPADVLAPLRQGLRAAVQGRDEVIDLMLIALLADGHVLLEDHPGSGKTTMARTLGSLILGDARTAEYPAFRRIQFTPDLLPSDITGVSIFDPSSSSFHFRRGPLFAHVVLADEINRTSPKVQAALLEAMGEKQVTAEDRTMPLDELFMVIATQNPYDGAGTYPLPAAQLDRFLFKIRMDYLNPGHELAVLRNRQVASAPIPAVHPVSREHILYARSRVQRFVTVSDRIHICLVEVANALRKHSRVAQGPSTRSLVLMESALKAAAALEGRDFATAEDVGRLAARVFTHRVLLNGAGRNRNDEEAEKVVAECLSGPLERLIRSSMAAPLQFQEGDTIMRAGRSIAAILFSLLPLMAAPSMTFPEADEQLRQGRYVDVLEFALETLRHDPDSFPALYLLGAALHHGEGNLPLAQRRLEQAKRIVERKGGYSALSDDEKKMYVETLEALFEVCGQSEQYKEQLQIVDLARLQLGQDWAYRSGWALMKLGRTDEARSLMKSYAQNSDPDIRATVMNTLGAIESAAGNLEVSYEWFTKIMNDEEAKKTFGGATLYANRSETATSLLWFGRAESDLLEAVKHFSRGTYSNPWSDLTMLYTGEGKLPLAIDAARQMRDWDRSSDAEMEQLRWNLNTRMRAILLLAVGHDRAALNTLEMVLRRPDRQGTTSSDPAEAEICLLAVYDEALRVNRERAWETLSWRRPSAWFGVLREVANLSMEDWSTRSRLRALVMQNDKLAWILRPYTQDTVIPEWVRPSMVAALGDGMAVNRLRSLLKTAPERERPYLRETLGESEVRDGHFRSGIELLGAALHELPQEEPLLRARAHAMLAEAQERSGRTDEARLNYLKAFELDACVFRSLSLSIPVSIRTDGDKASRLAASWIESSRRFRAGNALIIDVRHTSDGLEAILEDPSGAVLGRAGIRSSKNEDETARLLRDDAQQKFFAPRMNFEQADLKSLDSSPVSGGGL